MPDNYAAINFACPKAFVYVLCVLMELLFVWQAKAEESL